MMPDLISPFDIPNNFEQVEFTRRPVHQVQYLHVGVPGRARDRIVPRSENGRAAGAALPLG